MNTNALTDLYATRLDTTPQIAAIYLDESLNQEAADLSQNKTTLNEGLNLVNSRRVGRSPDHRPDEQDEGASDGKDYDNITNLASISFSADTLFFQSNGGSGGFSRI